MIVVIPVKPNHPQWADFLNLPGTLCSDEQPNRDPLNKEKVSKELSDEHPFRRHGQFQGYLALKNDRPVGRIVASVDSNLLDGAGTGNFGYFEAIKDEAIAKALFERCEEWLRQKGVQRIWGPVNLNIYTAYRLQISGFELSPFHGEPRNPAYYPGLFQACGYRTGGVWRSWDFSRLGLEMMERHLLAQVQRFQGRIASDFTVQPLERNQFGEGLGVVYRLAMEAFEGNWGFSRISSEEFMLAYMGTKGAPEGVRIEIAYDGTGEPVGFTYCYLDSFVQLGLAPELAGDKRLLVSTVAVVPKAQRTLAPHLLIHSALRHYLGTSYNQFIATLVKPGSTIFCDHLGKATRSYAVFEKQL